MCVSTKKLSLLCAAVLLLSAVLPFASSAYPASVPTVSSGLLVLAARTDVAVSAMVGNDVSFSADDFARGMNLSQVRYITIASAPSATDGELLLGSSRVVSGQNISAANLSAMVFHPVDDSVSQSSFTFTANGSTVPVTCNLYLLRNRNYAPTVSVAAGLTLSNRTYRGTAVCGTLSAQDPDGDGVIYEVVSVPKNGSVRVTDASQGTYLYQPKKGYVGTDSFSYIARDRYGNYSASATVSLRVEIAATPVNYVDLSESETVPAIAVTEAGIMSGTQIGNQYYFHPEGTVTRAEFLVMAMNAVGITDVPTVEETLFDDDDQIPATMKGYVSAAHRTGVISGSQKEGKLCFFPNDNLTRAEAAVMLKNLLGIAPTGSVAVFADESEIPVWATEAVETLHAVGILIPQNGNISPLSAITRAQAAELLSAAMRYQNS